MQSATKKMVDTPLCSRKVWYVLCSTKYSVRGRRQAWKEWDIQIELQSEWC
jgi:hypothetical protein